MPGTRKERLLRAIATGAVLMTMVLGCAQDPLSTVSDQPATGWTQAAGPSRSDQILVSPDGLGGPSVQLFGSYNKVASRTVKAGKLEVVEGSRYWLEFKEGSLQRQTLVTISERNPYIVDLVLSPDGIEFEDPVTLVINYAGTANDPTMKYYHGKPPAVFWYDEDAAEEAKNDNDGERIWVEIPGWDKPTEMTYTVFLYHFSRYAMSDGTGGWEGPARPRAQGGKGFVTTK